MRTRVKICGITRAADALEAARLGADAIGLVFYPSSPRAVDIAQAWSIVKAVPPFVTVVGLFVDAEAQDIRRVLQAVPIDILQFHGDEPPGRCGGYGRPYIKALRMRPGMDVPASAGRYGEAAGLLLDTYQEGVAGGTGRQFDWSQVPAHLGKPIILAGGLTPDNVGEAVRRVCPWAVDVSGGVESAKGIKDAAKMAAFIREVNRVQVD